MYVRVCASVSSAVLVRMCASVGVRVCGCLRMWVYKCVGLWVYGRLGIAAVNAHELGPQTLAPRVCV